jgi:hypothetical protein
VRGRVLSASSPCPSKLREIVHLSPVSSSANALI